MSQNKNLISEVWDYLKVRKAWWLIPLVVLFIVAGLLIIFTQGSAISTFVYALL